MNATVQRRTKLVLESGDTKAKVKSRKVTVEFPNAPENVLLNSNTGRKPRASSLIMLGRSIEIVIHISSDPKNTPSTPHAIEFKPYIGGIKREPIMRNNDNKRNIVSLDLPIKTLPLRINFMLYSIHKIS